MNVDWFNILSELSDFAERLEALDVLIRSIAVTLAVVGLALTYQKSSGGPEQTIRYIWRMVFVFAGILVIPALVTAFQSGTALLADELHPDGQDTLKAQLDTLNALQKDGGQEGGFLASLGPGVFLSVIKTTFFFVLYWVVTVIVMAMRFIQYLLLTLMLLVMPIMLCFALVPSFEQRTYRYLFNLLALQFWAIGFSVVQSLSLAVFTFFSAEENTLHPTYGAAIGSALAAFVLIIGLLMTPKVISWLLGGADAASGAALVMSGAASPAKQSLGAAKRAQRLARGRVLSGGSKSGSSSSGGLPGSPVQLLPQQPYQSKSSTSSR